MTESSKDHVKRLTIEQVKVIKEWIAALRSGEYKQGLGSLKHVAKGEIQHCCLGVLCELAVEKGIIDPAVKGNMGAWFFDGVKYNVPPTVVNWAGLKRPGDIGPLDFTTLNLMDMNDSDKTFEVIADFIEAHLVKYLGLKP